MKTYTQTHTDTITQDVENILTLSPSLADHSAAGAPIFRQFYLPCVRSVGVKVKYYYVKMCENTDTTGNKRKFDLLVDRDKIHDIIYDSKTKPLSPLHPTVAYYRNTFPLYLLSDNDQDNPWTDIPDYLIWQGLPKVSFGLSKSVQTLPKGWVARFENNISGFYSVHMGALSRSDTFIGPVGLASLIEYPLDFSHFLYLNLPTGIHGQFYGSEAREKDLLSSLTRIWDNQLIYIRDKFIDNLPSYSDASLNQQNNQLANRLRKATEAMRDIFLDLRQNLSLYERMLIYAHGWLALHVFVYYATKIVTDDDADGYSIVNFLARFRDNTTDKPWWSFLMGPCWQKDLNSFRESMRSSELRKRINNIELISRCVLSPEYIKFHFVSSDQRLRLHRAIREDLQLCANGMFEKLNKILKQRKLSLSHEAETENIRKFKLGRKEQGRKVSEEIA